MPKNILITGGLGFIGTNLIRRLLKDTKDNIIVLDSLTYAGSMKNLPSVKERAGRVRVICGDVMSTVDVKKAMKNVDIVVHLAGETNASRSINDPVPILQANIIGTTIILQAVQASHVKRCIIFSSSEIYGDLQKNYVMNEDHPNVPVTPYAVSKLAVDQLAHSFYLTQKTPVVVLRPFNVYGPFQHLEKMIPRFITLLLQDKKITLNNGGRPTRDFLFVDDLVDAIELAMRGASDKVIGQAFNIGTGKATSIKDVALKLVKLTGKNTKYLQIDTKPKFETLQNCGVSSKAKRTLRWKAKTSLDKGLAQTVVWYRDNQDRWK